MTSSKPLYREVDRLPESALPQTFDRTDLRVLRVLADEGTKYMLEQEYGEAHIVKMRVVDDE